MKTSPAAWGISSLISIVSLSLIAGFIWLFDNYEAIANLILVCMVAVALVAAIAVILVEPVQGLLVT
ncbi:MAG: hypothetical protein VX309_03565, partial [Pseudomonadota bacterium]|nr:hypothetical protein [Pseudomonadota bacterium]